MKCACTGPGFPCRQEVAEGSRFCTYCGDFCQTPPNTLENKVKRVRTLVEDWDNDPALVRARSEVLFALDGHV